ncbi:MAG: WXG100 family type VII secretion target [Anaerolineaceae bacterium]|nr:WXG100 family type VII secretion target [Anaerolineaceae bacterium]
MADTIQVNYEELERIARHFGDMYENIRQMNTRLVEQIDHLRGGGWLGVGANAFYAEMDNLLLPATNRFMEAMRSAEYTLKEITSSMQIAEEDAGNIVDKSMNDENGSGSGTGGAGGTGAGKATPKGSFGRTGNEMNSLLESFHVESNSRYAKFHDNNPNTYDTYCNLFAADVAKKLNAPLPLYVTDGNGKVTQWLGATAMKQWLDGQLTAPGQYTQGPANGWHKVSSGDAVNAANNGGLVVVAGHGHMAVVRSGGDPNAGARSVPIAQAGENNFSNAKLENGWGRYSNEAEFYVFEG